MASSRSEISECLYNVDLWDKLDIHLGSYVKSPLQLRYVSSKTAVIGRALRHAVVDLLGNVINNTRQHVENETTVIGTEHRVCHSRCYTLKIRDDENLYAGADENCDDDDELKVEISSLAPNVFSQLREDIGIPNDDFRRSFSDHHLKDFTNPGKSGSLMYKTFDDLFLLKTLRDYEARLLMQILSGYHFQLTSRPTIFNRYVGLYRLNIETSFSSIELYVTIMANAFTPSLKINEIFDLKGSKIKRRLAGDLSVEKLCKLKDMDFMDLYPAGIRIPTNVYEKLKLVVANDAKVLKKLNITDFSLVLGIRHIDMSETQMIERRPTSGVAALLRMSTSLALMHVAKPASTSASSKSTDSLAEQSTSYLKPLAMLDACIDTNLYYNNDSVAYASLPIPGIINKSNQRVYIYLAFVDMLQTFDNFKLIDQTFRRITDPNRHLEYSVIEPDDYEKRINQFLFEHVFIDAKDDFPWAITDVSKPVAKINNTETCGNRTFTEQQNFTKRRSHSTEHENSSSVLEFRL
ncbi:unnamed protein product [Adineta ricciae]|uniref:PIPK domain-containing protein n=1 Tax=Adineta ricciae TaxID=249248 RepID=A0A813QSF4_ADIRI|nr:unnamed protein product [Adineta ricciae]CAF0834355.1 unnamed protein product [Adineta ricciae]